MAIEEAQGCYRSNVAAIVVNDEGLILACERSDIPGCWQVPQGGLEPGETPEEAIRRELFEEIGVQSLEVLAEIPHLIRYEWPTELVSDKDKLIGQEQHYFLVRLKDVGEIHLDAHEHQEFTAVEWVTTIVFLSRLTNTRFKKAAIEEAIYYFQALGLID